MESLWAASIPSTAASVPDGGGAGREGELRPFTGTTEAHRKSTLTPRVGGTIAKVHVRDGDSVKAGDAIVSIDVSDTVLRVKQAEAALKTAEVQRTTAKIEWDRARLLLQDKAMPQSQFDAVDARLKGAEAGVVQAQVVVFLFDDKGLFHLAFRSLCNSFMKTTPVAKTPSAINWNKLKPSHNRSWSARRNSTTKRSRAARHR